MWKKIAIGSGKLLQDPDRLFMWDYLVLMDSLWSLWERQEIVNHIISKRRKYRFQKLKTCNLKVFPQKNLRISFWPDGFLCLERNVLIQSTGYKWQVTYQKPRQRSLSLSLSLSPAAASSALPGWDIIAVTTGGCPQILSLHFLTGQVPVPITNCRSTNLMAHWGNTHIWPTRGVQMKHPYSLLFLFCFWYTPPFLNWDRIHIV